MIPPNAKSIIDYVLGLLTDPKVKRLLIDGDFDEIFKLLGKAEQLVVNGIKRHPNIEARGDRFSMLRRFLFSDIDNLSGKTLGKRIANILIFLRDIEKYEELLSGSKKLIVSSYEISAKPTLDFHFYSNISTGLAIDYKRMKAYFANNHILSQALDAPGVLLFDTLDLIKNAGTDMGNTVKKLKIGLENGSKYVDKIDDLMIEIEIPQFVMKIGNKRLDFGTIKLEVSFDSKFLIDPSNVASKVGQQIALTFQDRVSKNLHPMLKQITSSTLSIPEQEEAVKKLIPVIFQHYIIRPTEEINLVADGIKPFPNDRLVPQEVFDKYADRFIEDALPHFKEVINDLDPNFLTNNPHLEGALQQGIINHANTHFRSERFIKETSQLTYFDF